MKTIKMAMAAMVAVMAVASTASQARAGEWIEVPVCHTAIVGYTTVMVAPGYWSYGYYGAFWVAPVYATEPIYDTICN